MLQSALLLLFSLKAMLRVQFTQAVHRIMGVSAQNVECTFVQHTLCCMTQVLKEQ